MPIRFWRNEHITSLQNKAQQTYQQLKATHKFESIQAYLDFYKCIQGYSLKQIDYTMKGDDFDLFLANILFKLELLNLFETDIKNLSNHQQLIEQISQEKLQMRCSVNKAINGLSEKRIVEIDNMAISSRKLSDFSIISSSVIGVFLGSFLLLLALSYSNKKLLIASFGVLGLSTSTLCFKLCFTRPEKIKLTCPNYAAYQAIDDLLQKQADKDVIQKVVQAQDPLSEIICADKRIFAIEKQNFENYLLSKAAMKDLSNRI